MPKQIILSEMMQNLFVNEKGEILTLTDIVYKRKIKKISFSYYTNKKNEKSYFLFKKKKEGEKKIFVIKDEKKIGLCPMRNEIIIYFSSRKTYEEFTDYDINECYKINNPGQLDGFPRKYEIHLKRDTVQEIDWE